MIPVGLSTAAVFPEPPERAFALAAQLGYDGVELMVSLDRTSQDVDAIAELSRLHSVPVLAVHAPCLLITQHVWGSDPWRKLERTADAARRLGARIVVVHPPFAWQLQYARRFSEGLADLTARYRGPGGGLLFAVENMFPLGVGGRVVSTYRPGWRVEDGAAALYDDVTLDVSHTAASASDVLAMQSAIGPALRHLHLGDGLAAPDGRPGRDEHLSPGRGTQPCAQVLRGLPSDYAGAVILEINTRSAATPEARVEEIAHGLAFTREHLGAAR
jgi:sugar phosphate isomerase/epimerase